MPLSEKGETIKAALVKEYGKERGTSILYAGENKGTFTGIHDAACPQTSYMDACRRGDGAAMASHSAAMLRGRVVR